ncbi:hypothetical protein A6A08_23820 [Nocardiopsis sp. TSRI0078]|uniref:hypothetical protein n=1 Tax=unclassified Nocardiopsis TaxID=2649073 RepID=UPI00093C48B9|nr:hypothetical protein [Nocardiopsis sp. TSRI0078]OKI20237.1 hypothetical protein A6A08_23820 [Nocardiopsis sp. TSRI0078]
MEPSGKPHHGHSHEPAADHTALDPTEVAECPVMRGTMVVKTEAEENGLVREYGGQLYYLCCDSCGALWDASPEEYAG